MRRTFGISLLWLLATACNTSSEMHFDDGSELRISIAELKGRCRGNSTPITESIHITGVVTANDIRGEFDRMLILEDSTGGIELAADHTALADRYPLGAAVTVYCSGLAVGDYGGKVRLGARPTSDYSVDRIARTDLDRYLRCTSLNAGLRRPRTRRFGELRFEDADRYARFEGVRFAEAGEMWCNHDTLSGAVVATFRSLVDTNGDTLRVRIGPRSHYATEPIPFGTGSVHGVVDYFNGTFSLRIVNYEIDFTTSAMRPKAYL